MKRTPLYVDANMINRVIFPDDTRGRIARKVIERQFEIRNNVIPLIEAVRARLSVSKRNALMSMLLGRDVDHPDLADWRKSVTLLREWKARRPEAGVEHVRKMQLDCLLAAMAVRTRTAVLTNDGDFALLREIDPRLMLPSPVQYGYN